MKISEVIDLTYEDLLMESDDNNLITKEKDLPVSKGRIKGNRIAINKSLSETEKKCVLAEELGHYHTANGNILDQSLVSNRKLEMRGRIYAYNKLVGIMGIVKAFENGCRTLYEMAEYLEVTEEFLSDALQYYKRKYGTGAKIDNYAVIFEPSISIMEIYC